MFEEVGATFQIVINAFQVGPAEPQEWFSVVGRKGGWFDVSQSAGHADPMRACYLLWQVLGQWSGLFAALPPRFFRDVMNGLTIINIDVLPFMDLECMDPGSYFYKNMVLKASIPLALGLFATGAFSYLNRRSRAAHDEATSTRFAEYKSAVIVFTLFMLNLLHPRWVAWPSLRDRPLPNVAVCTLTGISQQMDCC